MKRGEISFWFDASRCTDRTADSDARATTSTAMSPSWVAACPDYGPRGRWRSMRPDLSIAVLEAECLGFGASGRNGGWMSAKQVGVRRALARGAGGAKAVTEMQDRLEWRAPKWSTSSVPTRSMPVEVVGPSSRGPASELRRAENYVAESRRWGLDESSIRMMSAEETYERIHARGIVGAIHSPHNYCVDPVKMVFRLAVTGHRRRRDRCTRALA